MEREDAAKTDEVALRMELEALKPSALQKWAANAGVPTEDLDQAVDDENPKAALIALCMAATVRTELHALKQSALQKKALAAGVSSDEIDNAVDADDPKQALIDLVLGKKRSEPPGSTLRREIHSSPDPVKLSLKQSSMQLESVRAGDLARRKLSEDHSDYTQHTGEGSRSYAGDFDYPDPDSPITIVKTNSERSRGTHGGRHGFQSATQRRTSADSERSSERKPNSRRGSFDRSTPGVSSRRGSFDRMSSYSKNTSRRGSFASTLYDDDDENQYFANSLPPGSMPPPFGSSMPPMGMPPMAPPGFMNNNPWAAMAAAAAMGSPPGMPMMPPPGYAGPWWPRPPFNPEMGYPPNLGVSAFPGSDHNPERRGSNPDNFMHSVSENFQHSRSGNNFNHTRSGDSIQHRSSEKSSRGGSRRGSEDRSSAVGQSQRSGAGAGAGRRNAQPEEKKVIEPPAKPTTLVLRDLPEIFSRNKLQDLLDKYAFKGQYDFIYMPMNFRTKASFGYAFVNFVGNTEAQRCHDEFHGFTNWDVPSQKVCDVSWSNIHQGLAVHVDRYRNSPVMHESVEDEYKPALFEHGTGARAIFPSPTKKLRVPRIRRPGDDGDGDGDDGETREAM